MLKLFWLEFLDTKTELFCFLSLTWVTEVVFDLIKDDVWSSKYEETDALNDRVDSKAFLGGGKLVQCLCPYWIVGKNKSLLNSSIESDNGQSYLQSRLRVGPRNMGSFWPPYLYLSLNPSDVRTRQAWSVCMPCLSMPGRQSSLHNRLPIRNLPQPGPYTGP